MNYSRHTKENLSFSVPSDDIEFKVHRNKRGPSNKTSFAKELFKDESELRCSKKDKEDREFKRKVDEMIAEINNLEVVKPEDIDDYEEECKDICATCGDDILDNAVVVGEDNYHETCFICDNCGTR